MKKYFKGRKLHDIIIDLGSFFEDAGCAVTIRYQDEISVIFPSKERIYYVFGVERIYYVFGVGLYDKLFVKEVHYLSEKEDCGPFVDEIIEINLMDFDLLPPLLQDYILINPNIVWDLEDLYQI